MADDPELPPRSSHDENRSSRRLRTLRRGRIVLSNYRSSFDVMIRDLSPSGVKLKLAEIWAVPAAFELHLLKPDGTLDLAVPCRTEWQSGILVGATFTRPLPSGSRQAEP